MDLIKVFTLIQTKCYQHRPVRGANIDDSNSHYSPQYLFYHLKFQNEFFPGTNIW